MTIVPHVTGARQVEWTAEDDASVAVAAQEFAQLRQAGFLAYTATAEGDVQVFEFDPEAERITLAGPLAGG